MSRLAVILDWPNGNTPWVSMATLWNSDIRREPDVILLRAISPDANLSANMAVKSALEQGVDELYFCAADQGVPKDVLKRLRSHNASIAGCLVATRQAGHHWLAFNWDDEGNTHLVGPSAPAVKCDMVAPGAMLVKADVFRKVPPPWFKTDVSPDGCTIETSCDFYFFGKCKEYGIDVVLDATIESPHLHEVLLNARALHRQAPFLVETQVLRSQEQSIVRKTDDKERELVHA